METTEETAPMGRTSIQVSDELADDLHERKQRGDSYEDVIWRLIGRAGGEFVAKGDQKSITYGPSSEIEDGYVLTITTDSQDQVEVHFPEDAMYELWTEVQHTPWPDTLHEQDEAGELRHQLVDLAMGADAETLQDAVDVLNDRSEV